ncbi:MAG: N-acetyl-gamma-glutamyl-phosphate reductase, partial [uncultured Acetobacteraceae bacterium]
GQRQRRRAFGVHRRRGRHHGPPDPRAPGALRGRGAGALHRAGAAQGPGRQARADGRGGRGGALPAGRGGEGERGGGGLARRPGAARAGREQRAPRPPRLGLRVAGAVGGAAGAHRRGAARERAGLLPDGADPVPPALGGRGHLAGGAPGRGERRVGLHRRRQVHDRGPREGRRQRLRAVRAGLRAQARPGIAAPRRAFAASDLRPLRGALPAGDAVLHPAAPGRAAGRPRGAGRHRGGAAGPLRGAGVRARGAGRPRGPVGAAGAERHEPAGAARLRQRAAAAGAAGGALRQPGQGRFGRGGAVPRAHARTRAGNAAGRRRRRARRAARLRRNAFRGRGRGV